MRRGLLVFLVYSLVSAGEILQHRSWAQTFPTRPPPEKSVVPNILASAFSALNLAPIIVPAGEKVGDIVDIQTSGLMASADECFPGLRARRDASELPDITFNSEKGLAAGLGVTPIGEFKGQKAGTSNYRLSFEDVRFEKVSRVKLRMLLKKSIPECASIQQFLDTKMTIIDKPPPILIGMVFYAKRVIHVETLDNIEGEGKATFASEFMRRLGLTTNFEAKSDNKSKNTFDIVGKHEVPVAFAPAIAIRSINETADGKKLYEVGYLDPALIQNKIQVALGLERKLREARLLSEKADLEKRLKEALAQLRPGSLRFSHDQKTGRAHFAAQKEAQDLAFGGSSMSDVLKAVVGADLD